MLDRPVTALLLAAGRGARMATPQNKVIMGVAGKPILEWSLLAFEAAPRVDDIIIVSHAELVASAEAIVAERTRSVTVIIGGETRSASTLAGLNAIAGDRGTVLVHDAARPLVTPAEISRLIDALSEDDAATLAVPARDTMLLADGNHVAGIPSRAEMWHAQTPQGFSLSILREAFAADGGINEFTDECSIVSRYLPDVPIRIVAGSEDNLKITHPGDLAIAENILTDRK